MNNDQREEMLIAADLLEDHVIYINRKPNDKIDKTILKMDNWGGPWPEDTVLANNIFYVQDTASFHFGEDKRTLFTNNVCYGRINNLPEDSAACTLDPKFQHLPLRAPDGLEDLKAFLLQKGSPCIGAGLPIPNNGGRDFFGNAVTKDGPSCIGAHAAND